MPDPSTPIPAAPVEIAALLARTTRALDRAIGAWSRGAGLFHRPPADVVLPALLQQRIFRVLGRDPALAARAIAALPAGQRGPARSTEQALVRLFALTHPVANPAAFETQPPEPAGSLLRDYREAQRRFGVGWAVLAAVNFVESKFGRSRSDSGAGAQGPMQFLPSTWSTYGMGGDVHDPHDAILGAANFLRANGGGADIRRALFAYNHSVAYVDAVLAYANEMERDPTSFLELYNWQVFVVTTAGDVRLTGPGLG
jgi:hypothetical protein